MLYSVGSNLRGRSNLSRIGDKIYLIDGGPLAHRLNHLVPCLPRYRLTSNSPPISNVTMLELASSAHSFEVLRTILTQSRRSDRAPPCLDASLEAARAAPDDSLPRSLLRAGFQVWFAHCIAVQDGLLPPDLDNLSPEDRTRVASIKPDPSIEELFTHLFRTSQRAPKRRGSSSSRYF